MLNIFLIPKKKEKKKAFLKILDVFQVLFGTFHYLLWEISWLFIAK